MKTHNTFAIPFGIFALALTLTTTGCMESFDPASLIAGTRILGARVTVEGDTTRSSPMAGETVTVEWLVEAPGPLPALAWAFAVCTSPQSCAPVAQGDGLPMRFSWSVPADASVGPRAQVLGQVCENGSVTWNGAQAGCSDGAKGTTVSQDIFIARDGFTNAIPDVSARPLSFDGTAWTDGETCGGVPAVALGSKGHTLVLTMLAEDREVYTALDGDPPAPVSKRETLQVSSFTTAGELGRSFSYVEAEVEDATSDVEINWDAPDSTPAEGPLVRFLLVVRDGRGGLSFVERAVCLQ